MEEKKDCLMEFLDKVQEQVDIIFKRMDEDIAELKRLREESEKEYHKQFGEE